MNLNITKLQSQCCQATLYGRFWIFDNIRLESNTNSKLIYYCSTQY